MGASEVCKHCFHNGTQCIGTGSTLYALIKETQEFEVFATDLFFCPSCGHVTVNALNGAQVFVSREEMDSYELPENKLALKSKLSDSILVVPDYAFDTVPNHFVWTIIGKEFFIYKSGHGHIFNRNFKA